MFLFIDLYGHKKYNETFFKIYFVLHRIEKGMAEFVFFGELFL